MGVVKISPGQLRQIIKMVKDAPSVTPRVITVDHLAELQSGDVIIKVEHETGDTGTFSQVRATVLRNEKEVPDEPMSSIASYWDQGARGGDLMCDRGRISWDSSVEDGETGS